MTEQENEPPTAVVVVVGDEPLHPPAGWVLDSSGVGSPGYYLEGRVGPDGAITWSGGEL